MIMNFLYWILILLGAYSHGITIAILLSIIFIQYKVKKIKASIKASIETSIKNYTFPPSVEASLKIYNPLLTNRQRKEVLKYLRIFLIDRLSNIDSDTPSVVLNKAWRVFSLSKEYDSFPYQHFYYHFFIKSDFLKYKPISKDSCGIIKFPKNKKDFFDLWKSQCHAEGIDLFFPQKIPNMFMLDETLNIEDGIKFKINKIKLRKLLDIEEAPSPNQLIREIKEIKSGYFPTYLAKKLKYYLGNKNYCKLYQEKEFHNLFREIQDHNSLSSMIFGVYGDINFYIEHALKNSAPPPDEIGAGCSGASV